MEAKRNESAAESFARAHIQINAHSSIRIEAGELVLYVDPFQLKQAPQDADLVFFTHDHFDHLSPPDVERVSKPETVFVAPASAEAAAGAAAAGRPLVLVEPGGAYSASGLAFEAVPAYNPAKPFHPKQRRWVGYLLQAGGLRIYVAGDTDATEEAAALRCDVALLPIGGKYTMDPPQAAGLANAIRPAVVIPTHFGAVAGSAEDGERFAALVDPAICVIRKI